MFIILLEQWDPFSRKRVKLNPQCNTVAQSRVIRGGAGRRQRWMQNTDEARKWIVRRKRRRRCETQMIFCVSLKSKIKRNVLWFHLNAKTKRNDHKAVLVTRSVHIIIIIIEADLSGSLARRVAANIYPRKLPNWSTHRRVLSLIFPRYAALTHQTTPQLRHAVVSALARASSKRCSFKLKTKRKILWKTWNPLSEKSIKMYCTRNLCNITSANDFYIFFKPFFSLRFFYLHFLFLLF